MADLFGKYQLLARIAAGTVAEVFQAKSHGVEGFEKVVVIKRIRRGFSADTRFVESFIEAAKKAVMLSHANVVQVFDLGQHDDCYYLAMEHIAGPDFGRILGLLEVEERRLPLDLALWAAAEVAKGLDHAHRRRDYEHRLLDVVHAGVFPANVLSSREGEVKLTDFGFTLALRRLLGGRPDLLARDEPYLAPEVLSPEADVDERADLYGVGALLHRFVHGVPPDPDSPPPERDLPEGVTEVFDRTLQADRNARYDSAGQLYERLITTIFENGWKPNPRTWADFLGELVDVQEAATSEERLEELSLDDVLVIDDEFDEEVDVADADLLAVFDDSRTDRTAPVPVEPDSGKLPPPTRETAIERPGGRRSALHRIATSHAVIAAIHTPSGEEPPDLEAEADRWGARIVRIPSLPPAAVFDSGSIPARALERALRFALALARVKTRRPSVGVHMGTMGGRVRVDELQPDHDDASVVRACDLARSGLPGDVLVSEAGPRHLPDVFSCSPPFSLSDGKAAHRVGPSQVGTAIVRGVTPGPSTRRAMVAPPDEAAPRTRRGTLLVPPGREDVCGFEEDDGPEVLREKIGRLAQLGVAAEDVRGLHDAFGLGPGSPAQRDWVALFSATLRRVALGLGVDRPTALVFEDSDHLDPESRSVVADVVEHLEGGRVLLWFSGPPGTLDDLLSKPGAIRRRLSQLPDLGLKFLVGDESVRGCALLYGGKPFAFDHPRVRMTDLGFEPLSGSWCDDQRNPPEDEAPVPPSEETEENGNADISAEE